MAKKKITDNAFVFFDVTYQDGSQSSHRRVPGALLTGLDGDLPARTLIEQQDREIAEKSGRPRGPIKAFQRSAKQA